MGLFVIRRASPARRFACSLHSFDGLLLQTDLSSFLPHEGAISNCKFVLPVRILLQCQCSQYKVAIV